MFSQPANNFIIAEETYCRYAAASVTDEQSPWTEFYGCLWTSSFDYLVLGSDSPEDWR